MPLTDMKVKSLNICSQIFRFAIATGRAEADPTYATRGAIIKPPASRSGRP
jgi:hypothetical protein